MFFDGVKNCWRTEKETL